MKHRQPTPPAAQRALIRAFLAVALLLPVTGGCWIAHRFGGASSIWFYLALVALVLAVGAYPAWALRQRMHRQRQERQRLPDLSKLPDRIQVRPCPCCNGNIHGWVPA